MLTHMPMSEPKARLVPIRMPSPIPIVNDRAIPIPNACSVIRAASSKLDEDTTSPNEASTSENGGINEIQPARPSTSQMTSQTSRENTIGTR